MILLVAAELMPVSVVANCSKSESAWGFMFGSVRMLLFTSGFGL